MPASKQYFAPETAVVFKGSGGDVTLTFASAADQSLSVSDQHDRGTGSKPGLYRVFARNQINASGTVGRQIRYYIVGATDATDIPGRLGTTDTEIASAADRTRNLSAPALTVICDSTSTSDGFIASGLVFISTRYISIAVFNDTGVALHATESSHYFAIQPIPAEQQ